MFLGVVPSKTLLSNHLVDIIGPRYVKKEYCSASNQDARPDGALCLVFSSSHLIGHQFVMYVNRLRGLEREYDNHPSTAIQWGLLHLQWRSALRIIWYVINFPGAKLQLLWCRVF